MVRKQYSLDVEASVAAGDPLRVEEQDEVWVKATGTFDATIVIQGSDDNGSTWADVATFTGPTVFPLSFPYKWMRANTTVYTSGTPAVSIDTRLNRS
jgi:hypothetical protein